MSIRLNGLVAARHWPRSQRFADCSTYSECRYQHWVATLIVVSRCVCFARLLLQHALGGLGELFDRTIGGQRHGSGCQHNRQQTFGKNFTDQLIYPLGPDLIKQFD